MPTDAARRIAAIVGALDGADRDLLFRCLDPRMAARVRRVERDQLLGKVAGRFFRNAASGSERARQIAQASRRYAASAWHHDQRRRRSFL